MYYNVIGFLSVFPLPMFYFLILNCTWRWLMFLMLKFIKTSVNEKLWFLSFFINWYRLMCRLTSYFYSSVYTCINNKKILYYWFLCKNKAIHYRFFIEHIRNADLQIVYRWPITLVLTGQLLIIHSIYHDDKKFNFLFKKVKRL